MAMTRSGATADDENDDHKKFMSSTAKRMSKMQRNQPKAMPKCTGGEYVGPTIITHNVEKVFNQVITNETHSKATNCGFSRGEGGRTYCH